MTSRDFVYWLQGHIELASKGAGSFGPLSPTQVKCIADHLALVFVHEIDPSAGGSVEQAKLNALHEGVTKKEVDQAIKEAIDKLPRPQRPTGEILIRC